MRAFYYVYPMNKVVSFTIVAKKHIQYGRRFAKIYEIDENNIRHFYPALKLPIAIHPFFYNAEKLWPKFVDMYGNVRDDYIQAWKSRFMKVVGVDVADSDAISSRALELLKITDEMIVPSTWAKEAYVRSGYFNKIHVIPHGVDPHWYDRPPFYKDSNLVKNVNPIIAELYELKKAGTKVLLFWLWHSAHRKGWEEVVGVYRMLRAKRKDVVLVVKTVSPWPRELDELKDVGVINVYGWLDEFNKMALYDVADITLNFSRGGGFEMNCLESLARGVPCVAGVKGGWSDYMPNFLTIKQCGLVRPLPDNPIHSGYGFKICVEEALRKIEDILDNYKEYRAKTEEHKEELAKVYRWDVVAHKFVDALFT